MVDSFNRVNDQLGESGPKRLLSVRAHDISIT